ncbi:hypothetical protein RQM59_13775 [Flavobacteriaceae bacterium S356]|uniref:Uncharacterized protein n=1 Tax=Asprobacillus argus TaxID=3076534 RepID=A0ABU3LID0_9FLAO|nr:hypothetical protein [Flavobacteriaceae bacterium S356]
MYNLLKALLILLFFQGVFSIVGIPSTLYKSAIDLIIYIIFAIALMKNNNNFNIPYRSVHVIFIGFSVVVFLSTVFNASSIFKSFSFYRNTLNGYLFFLAISNIRLRKDEVKKLTQLLFILVAIQPIASVMKYLTVGVSEDYIGTFSLSGGAYSTMVPLTFISVLYALFLYKRKKIYLALILGYVFMAFVGDKRAFWFILPVVLFGIHLLYQFNYSNRKVTSILKSMIILVLSGPLLVYLGGRALPSLNPDYKFWGRFDLQHIMDYATSYNTGSRFDDIDYGVGRVGGGEAMIASFKTKSLKTNLIGDGPDIFVDRSNDDDITYRYGVYLMSHFTGIMVYLPSIGYVGAFFLLFYYLSMLFLARRRLKIEKRKKSIQGVLWLAIIVVTLLIAYDYLLYTKTFVHSNIMNVLYFLLLGSLVNKKKCFFHESTFRK